MAVLVLEIMGVGRVRMSVGHILRHVGDLMLQAKDGALSSAPKTKQAGSRPGYCTVRDKNGMQLFQLYFDGGSERKLQVKHLLKSACKVHGTWQFKGLPQTRETAAETLLELDPEQA